MFPWLEWAPAAEVEITNFPVDYGDFITVIVCAGPGPNATNAAVYFTNRITGAYTSLNFTAPAGISLAGNCAEWIVEAPNVGGLQSAMADYGQVSFTNCQACVGATRTIVDAGTGRTIDMVDSTNTTVSAGSFVGSTGVQCDYVGTLP
jgi:hypothetical protein